MVNNQFMGQPQIPVQVEGKTYYGCCAMCKGRLQSDASARMASDPVSHTPVDKATAVIGRLPNGSTLYFASREHFDSYSRRAHAP
jgi:YHS domain-containing protein